MAATDDALADFNTAAKACQDAISASDLTTARLQYAVAQAASVRIPARITVGSVDTTWRETLKGLREAIEYLAGATTGATDNRRMIRTQMGF